jgi:hypothetical protein
MEAIVIGRQFVEERASSTVVGRAAFRVSGFLKWHLRNRAAKPDR